MPLKGVLFDLWETLINDLPERGLPRRDWRRRRVVEALSAQGWSGNHETVLEALDATMVAISRMEDTGFDTNSAGRALLFADELAALAGVRPPEAALHDIEVAITEMPFEMAPVLAPGALETVVALKQRGLALALVCNAGFTTAPHLRSLLNHYGLLPHFDALVFSDEHQIAKPNARIFHVALEALGLGADACAFIGDNPHTDISGALAAGLFAIQIGAKERDGITPHARVSHLSQLVEVLEATPAAQS